MNKKLRVSIVGTNGIPAKYGGYETLAENLTYNLNKKFDFTIYCSRTQRNKLKKYHEARLINLPLKANGWQSILYDILSLIHSILFSDVILYLGPSAGFFIPLLKLLQKKIIVNHGGLNEWEREKFTSFQKRILKFNHKIASKYSTYNIADNNLLVESLKQNFGARSIFVIRYGGDNATKIPIDDILINKYSFLKEPYFVNVSRAQVDNNLHIVLEAFSKMPQKKLVMISNWSISAYGENLKAKYKDVFANITMLDAIYDKYELNAIRSNALCYIHSHSYCGTSPSLVEAMSLELPIIYFDVPTNQETTKNSKLRFKSSLDLEELISDINESDLKENSREMKQIAVNEYTWKSVSLQYAELFKN